MSLYCFLVVGHNAGARAGIGFVVVVPGVGIGIGIGVVVVEVVIRFCFDNAVAWLAFTSGSA